MQWVHRRLRQEEGVSLVETLVGILLLGVVLMALGSTLTGSMAAARQDESLTHGTALATEVLEELHAVPWAHLGFYNNDGPHWRAIVPELGGLSTVSRGTLPASPEPDRLVPMRTVNRDGKTYSVRTDIVWQASPRYIRMRVQVTWSDGTATRNVTLEGRRMRRSSDSGGLSMAPEGFVIKVFNVNPDPMPLTSGGLTVGSTEYGGAAGLIEVETNEPAQSVTVTWAPSRSATLTAVSGSGNLRWTAPVPANQSYSHGYVTFTATATRQGAPTTQYVDQTAAMFAYPVAVTALNWDTNNNRSYVGSATLTGDRICINATNQVRNNHPFNVTFQGLGDDDIVTLVRTNLAGALFPMAFQAPVTNGGSFSVTLTPAQMGTFSLNTISPWEIRWTRTYDNVSGVFPLPIYVRNANGGSWCGST